MKKASALISDLMNRENILNLIRILSAHQRHEMTNKSEAKPPGLPHLCLVLDGIHGNSEQMRVRHKESRSYISVT